MWHLTLQGAAEQIKRFGGVGGGGRLVHMVSLCSVGLEGWVVGVDWCTWSPSALLVWIGTQLGVIGPYFFEEEGVTVTVNSERYVAMLRPEW
jgi:hypothetical protein